MRISDWSSDVCSSDLNPATGAVIGQVIEADAGTVEDAIAVARAAQDDWSLAGGAFRAERLERAADLIEDRDAQFLGLAMDAAGKTLAAAVAAVPAAVDFLRSYAAQARADFTARKRVVDGKSVS